MNRGLKSKIYLVCLLLGFVVATSPALMAQVPAPPQKPDQQIPSPPQKPSDQISFPPSKAVRRTERQLGRVSLPAGRGVRVLVDNRTSGQITVHGWDRDTIEAHAVSDRGEEVLMFAQSEDDGPKEVFLKADYANLDNAATPTEPLELPPLGN